MHQPRHEEPTTPAFDHGSARLTLAQLRAGLAEVAQEALLVAPRILRRVIREHTGVVRFGLRVPHRKNYTLDRDALLAIVDPWELGIAEGAQLPERMLLLPEPSTQRLASTPADELLTQYWRWLFHCRVHAALDERLKRGKLGSAEIRQRIHAIGETEFAEIRLVLDQENLLLPPRNDESVYCEFVATYLELRFFTPGFVSRYFPGIRNRALDGILAQDVDASGLYSASRPDGASQPREVGELDEWIGLSATADGRLPELPPPEIPSETKYRVLMRKSRRPAEQGNIVRAAIYRAWAERCAPAEMVDRVRVAIKLDLAHLGQRLQAALEVKETSSHDWQEALFCLLAQTPRGIWTNEARLLYDLQKVCVDYEREIYRVDLVEWVLSWGRRPIKRRLPNQRDVLMLRHLHSALRRVPLARISQTQRGQLACLLREAAERVETRLRNQLRPILCQSLDEVGLVPRNLPERLARKKLIEEILDQVSQRGYVTMGGLRDAISRNRLKLPDVSGPRELFYGDALLRADRKLGAALEGVYHRGEIYLRMMQRASSLGFGTVLGRVFTKFIAVPYGGAFVTLFFLLHVWDLFTKQQQAEEVHLTSPSVLALGTVLLLLVNSASVRQTLGNVLSFSGQLLNTFVVEPIRWVVNSSLVQMILRGRLFTLLVRLLIKPLIVTLAIRWVVPTGESPWWMATAANVSLFLAVCLMLNSRAGRTLQEAGADWMVQGWHRFGVRFLAGVFWFFLDLFKGFLQTVERLMYTVDEWLRFRSDEGRFSLATKAVLGLVWFVVAYVVRFTVNVLVEPQINPIKHFPVVTVGHKLLIPLYKPFANLLEASMGLSTISAWTAATTIGWCIPGVFGFLVWELKENWRLYAANRRRELGPVRIGSHGETLARLLRPGVHSGTLPKSYRKLRRAERRARASGDWSSVPKHLQAIHHVAVSLRRYVEREFLELFEESKCWQLPPVSLSELAISTNAIWLSLRCSAFDNRRLEVAIEAESGWILAGVRQRGWADDLLPQQKQVLVTALLGLYKSAGVNLVRQQIEGEFPASVKAYDLTEEGLRIWPGDDFSVEVLYDLGQGQWLAPQAVRGLSRVRLPVVERERLLFSDIPIGWDRWVEAWNQDVAGRGHPRESVAPVRVLDAGRP